MPIANRTHALRASLCRCAGVFALTLVVCSSALAQAQLTATDPPPIADFFRRAQFANAQLSPSGRYLGMIAGSDTTRSRLVVLDLDDAMRVSVAAVFSDADVRSFEWLNDQRLVFDATDRHTDAADRRRPPGLWAVDRDGGEFRQLIESAGWETGLAEPPKTKRILPPYWGKHSTLDDGSADILVQEYRGSVGGDLIGTSVRRMNTRTGELRSVLDGNGGGFLQSAGEPSGTVQWLFDTKGRPAVVQTLRGKRATIQRRDAATGEWNVLTEFDAYTGQAFQPRAIDANGVLYGEATSTQGTMALYRWDDAARRPAAEPLVRIEGFDFDGVLVMDRAKTRLIGVHFDAEVRSTIWFDDAMRELQHQVDARLPQTHNRLTCGDCGRRVLVTSWSDRQPAVSYLLDRLAGQLRPLVEARPWIAPAAMGRTEFVRYKARDGREIPAYVTVPARPAQGLRPAVVLVHGGPYLRGRDGAWEPDAQFLASRGYVVIEPEFRGSTGFGFDHFRAGWKQWGLAMQDDLDDALRWAVEQRGVDPQRACIGGASYGGYAALMGLVREASPYRCAFEWVGVSDIPLIFDLAGANVGNRWYRYGMPTLVGDPDKDAAQLRATSPLVQAAKIRKPLLMAYGGADLTVPVQHGKDLRAALPQENADVEWVLYPDEGHGWFQLATNVDFWGRVERFLARHIGAGTK